MCASFLCRVCCKDLPLGEFSPSERRDRGRCRSCSRSVVARVQSNCRDCGTEHEMDWWMGRGGGWLKGGPHSSRCHPCYLAYTRLRQTARLHGRKHDPAVMAPRRLGPPRPKRILVECEHCGSLFERSNASLTCGSCASAHRGSAEDRRRNAVRQGDSSIHWRPLGERDGWKCHLCGERVLRRGGTAHEPRGATVDHIVPIVDGGVHEWHNVALAHRHCNVARGAAGVVQLRMVG